MRDDDEGGDAGPRRRRPAAIAAPALAARGGATAYQMPIAATARPTCSFVAIAAAASRANAQSRSSSSCHHAKRSSGQASATGWKSLKVSHCTGGESRYASASAAAGQLRVEVLACEPEDRQRAGGDGDRLDDEQQLGIRPEPPERRERDEDRVEVRAQPRDLLAVHVRHRERSPCAVDQTAWVMLPRSKRPLSKARCRRTASAPKPAAKAAAAAQTTRAGVSGRAARRARASVRRGRPRSRARGRRASPPAPIVRASSRIAGEPAHGRRQRSGIAGRDEQRALAVAQQLARRRACRP